MKKEEIRAVLRNVQNNDLYLHLGDDMYKNLRTGKEGEIKPELASAIFNINIPMTVMISENPNIKNLINRLQLKIEQ